MEKLNKKFEELCEDLGKLPQAVLREISGDNVEDIEVDDVSDGNSPDREDLYISAPAQMLSMGGVNVNAVSSSSCNPRFSTTGKTLSYKQEKKA